MGEYLLPVVLVLLTMFIEIVGSDWQPRLTSSLSTAKVIFRARRSTTKKLAYTLGSDGGHGGRYTCGRATCDALAGTTCATASFPRSSDSWSVIRWGIASIITPWSRRQWFAPTLSPVVWGSGRSRGQKAGPSMWRTVRRSRRTWSTLSSSLPTPATSWEQLPFKMRWINFCFGTLLYSIHRITSPAWKTIGLSFLWSLRSA